MLPIKETYVNILYVGTTYENYINGRCKNGNN